MQTNPIIGQPYRRTSQCFHASLLQKIIFIQRRGGENIIWIHRHLCIQRLQIRKRILYNSQNVFIKPILHISYIYKVFKKLNKNFSILGKETCIKTCRVANIHAKCSIQNRLFTKYLYTDVPKHNKYSCILIIPLDNHVDRPNYLSQKHICFG